MNDADRDLRTEASSEARRFYIAGHASLPHVDLGYNAFERYFCQQEAMPIVAYAGDMYLAYACAERVDVALGELERLLKSEVARAVATVDPSTDFVEEILQLTRHKLLVSRSGGAVRIASYAGRASLKAWLRAVAVRTAISQRRRRSAHRREAAACAAADEPLAKGGPELDYLRLRYKGAFEDALRAAIAQLPAKERMLLRLNVIDRMSIDQLAVIYRIGRSTAARWLTAARQALFEATRREIRARMELSSAELESLARDVQSQLDVSVVKLLGHGDGGG